MKKLVVLLLTLAGWKASVAQEARQLSGWYVQPQISIGIAKQFVGAQPSVFYAYNPGLHVGGGVLAGRSFDRWQVESGLMYWINKTARETQNVNFADQFDPLTGTTTASPTRIDIQERYQHLVLPLRMGII